MINHSKSLKLLEANKTLALAGIFQSTFLIHQTAFDQELNMKAYETCIESIFKIDTPDTLSVYGTVQNIQIGLLIMMRHGNIEQSYQSKKITLNTIFCLSRLAKKVLSQPKVFEQIQRRLLPIISQVKHLGATHECVINELASLYKHAFLSRGLQVPVMGKQSSFKNPVLLNRIYALILAGVRSTVLWHQLGGSKIELFFSLTRLKEQAAYLLRNGQAFFLSHPSNV